MDIYGPNMRDPVIARVLAQGAAMPVNSNRIALFWWFALWLGTLSVLAISYADWSQPIGSHEFLRPVGVWPWVRFPFACSTIMVLLALESGSSRETCPSFFLRIVCVSNTVAVLCVILGLPSIPLERVSSVRHLSFLTALVLLHLIGFQRVESSRATRADFPVHTQ